MLRFFKAAILLPALVLSGCAFVDITNKPIPAGPDEVANWQIAGLEVEVPDSLTVSTDAWRKRLLRM